MASPPAPLWLIHRPHAAIKGEKRRLPLARTTPPQQSLSARVESLSHEQSTLAGRLRLRLSQLVAAVGCVRSQTERAFCAIAASLRAVPTGANVYLADLPGTGSEYLAYDCFAALAEAVVSASRPTSPNLHSNGGLASRKNSLHFSTISAFCFGAVRGGMERRLTVTFWIVLIAAAPGLLAQNVPLDASCANRPSGCDLFCPFGFRWGFDRTCICACYADPCQVSASGGRVATLGSRPSRGVKRSLCHAKSTIPFSLLRRSSNTILLRKSYINESIALYITRLQRSLRTIY